MRFNYMEQDQLRDNARRWNMQYSHVGLLNPTALAGGGLGLNLNINRASDNDYWKDFPLSNGAGVQRLLSTDGTLSWAKEFVTTSVTVQKWQTLQDNANPGNYITPPFDRVPQVNARLLRNDIQGFDLSLDGQFSRFESRRLTTCEQDYQNCNASRTVSVAQLSRPFITPYGYVTPKLQMHGRSYQFDSGLSTNGQSSASVSVPTFSLDSGIAFERSSRLFDRSWIQTLEPRAFYVFTPYREQNYLPNYDSGGNAFNFASIFAENEFGGHDRISDSKLLTLGATSRLIDPESGAEGARFALAQRLRMQDERVVLPGGAVSQAGISDILAGAGMNLSPKWSVESTVQYNPKTDNLLRRVVGGRYSPGSYRVINAALRSENDAASNPVSKQLDVGWQWPLHDLWGAKDDVNVAGRGLGEGRWYSVARMNYNMLEKRNVESVIGFEYDAGCWLSRAVVERMQVTDGLARQRILLQLEFVGFSRVGFNAMESLRNNVPRYQPLRQPTMTPSRFGNYD
jgi:LPS-assembly protein